MSLAQTWRRAGLALPLLVCSACAGGVKEDIQPGHRPSIDTDEAGLWMVMDRHEKSVKTSGRVETAPGLNAYVNDIMCQLAPEHCADIRIYIVRHPSFNATMAPNGMMTIWTGMLLRCENEAQLAYVIGHELAHYLRQHSLQRWRDAKAKTTAIAFAGMLAAMAGQAAGAAGAGGAVQSAVSAGRTAVAVGNMGLLFSILVFSRENEREADALGFELYTKAGYDAGEAAKIWKMLDKEAEVGDWPSPPLFMASHPSREERMATLERKARELSGQHEGLAYTERYLTETLRFRSDWLRDELRQRNFGSMEFVLNRLIEQSYDLGTLYYYRGELYQLRDEKGDKKKAIAAFREAAQHEDAPPETHRELGFVLWDSGDEAGARAAFETYLKAQPFAGDRPMIESYLEELT